MSESMKVVLSPPSFSFLLYETIKSKYGQEGFLIGEIIEKETKSITDNDQEQIHKIRTVKVNCCIPCPKIYYFYDSIGRLHIDRIKGLSNNLTNKIIGWYIYKPISSFSFTFREKIIHQKLTTLFNLPKEHFICCMLISEKSNNNSTHSYTQKFIHYSYKNRNYEELPLHIINLNDPNRSYKSPEPVSEQFNRITKDLKINLKETQGLTVITKIQNCLEKHTQQTVKDLVELEERVTVLENEIKQYKEIKLPIVKLEKLNININNQYDINNDNLDRSTPSVSSIENINSNNISNENHTETPTRQTRKKKKQLTLK